jgi:putative hydrolase of the HAD superfamily
MTSDQRRRPFLYFDMGNVLLGFSHERMAAQMAAAVGIEPQRAWDILFAGDLGIRHETGKVTNREFYDEFCRAAGKTGVDRDALDRAACDIFWLNVPLVAIVGRLNAAGYRLGILSNTNDAHWRYVTGRFVFLKRLFHVFAMSFEINVMKPDPRIYVEAARLAGVKPSNVFYTDDRAENVEGARAAGFDTVLFTTPTELSRQLWQRGIVGNY